MDNQHDVELLRDELRTTHQFLAALINNATVAFVVVNLAGVVLKLNNTFASVFGWSEAAILGQSLPIIPLDQMDSYTKMLQDHNCPAQAYETWRMRRDGTVFPASETCTPIYDGDGQVVAIALMIRDISVRKEQERRLQESEQRYKSLFEYNPNAIFSLDLEGNVLQANEKLEMLLGYELQEMKNSWWVEILRQEDLERAKLAFALACQGQSQTLPLPWKHRNGRTLHVMLTLIPIHVEQEIVGVYGIAMDETDQKRTAELVTHMAYHDSLTDLPNRRLFVDRVTEAIDKAVGTNLQVSVFFLDLDRFKYINDAYGHDVGDRVLKIVAKRLRSCVREHETVARLGGDEFTILLPTVSREGVVEKVARRILKAFLHPIMAEGHEFHLTPSIGIALFPADGQDAVELMKRADAAMYRAKQRGKNNFQRYTSDMQDSLMQEISRESEMHEALERGEFVVHYQPKVDVASERIVGMEALVRWDHPAQGVLPPLQFIPFAEETGLILPLGEFVLRESCAYLKQLQESGHEQLKVAVNISFKQLQHAGFVETVQAVLQETGLNPRDLELEITESLAIENLEELVPSLEHLAAMGIEISIDDFGTGYTSFQYLRQLPIQTLKIDKSFIQDLAVEQENSDLVAAMITMAHFLNIRVIAEGVESLHQLEVLRNSHCQLVQGYFFSKPLPPEEFQQLLHNQS